ncbi:hypothetical protein ACI65C_013475 [Semiaphis heraclei]
MKLESQNRIHRFMYNFLIGRKLSNLKIIGHMFVIEECAETKMVPRKRNIFVIVMASIRNLRIVRRISKVRALTK